MQEEIIFKDNIYSLKTNKYKTVNLYLYYSYPFDLKRRLSLSYLSCFLGHYTNTYDTKDKMIKVKDNLYGLSISSISVPKANLLTHLIKISFINPKFLKDIDTDDYLNFINECFDNVYFSDDLLCEFKKDFKNITARKLDDPKNYAANRIAQIIGEEKEEFKVYDKDYINVLDSISLDDVKNVYMELKSKFSLDTFLVGDYDDKMYNFAKNFKSNNKYYLNNDAFDIKDLGEIIEDKNVSQSMLSVVYKTPYTRVSKDFYAYMLGNCLLGMVPTSLLFEEVREKLSLCYYINIVDYKNEGLVKIYTAIDGKNKDTVLKQIDIQIQRIINKDYDFEKIDLARTLLIDALKSEEDDFDYKVDRIYFNNLNRIDCSVQDYINELNKVTADDIANIFKNYKHVLTYMLNGVKHE